MTTALLVCFGICAVYLFLCWDERKYEAEQERLRNERDPTLE